jgi:hypothetical protein
MLFTLLFDLIIRKYFDHQSHKIKIEIKILKTFKRLINFTFPNYFLLICALFKPIRFDCNTF